MDAINIDGEAARRLGEALEKQQDPLDTTTSALAGSRVATGDVGLDARTASTVDRVGHLLDRAGEAFRLSGEVVDGFVAAAREADQETLADLTRILESSEPRAGT